MARRLILAVAGVVMSGVLAVSAWGQQQEAKPAAPVKKVEKAPAKPRTEQDALSPSPHLPQRHEGFMKRKGAGPIGLLFLGDSITDGWPGKSPETWKTWEKYQVADFGVGGDRTEHVLWRIQQGELDGLTKTKAVVLMIGTNNVGHFEDEKPEWAAAGVKKILDEIHEKMPQAKVLLLGVFPRAEKADAPLRKKVEAINEIIAKYEGGNVKYMDIGSKFLEADGTLPKEIMPDSLHPNDKGYHIWRDAIEPTVDEMMK